MITHSKNVALLLLLLFIFCEKEPVGPPIPGFGEIVKIHVGEMDDH